MDEEPVSGGGGGPEPKVSAAQVSPAGRLKGEQRTGDQQLWPDQITCWRDSIPAQPRDAKMIRSIASLIRAKSKLLLLENPDTVEIYKSNLKAQREAKKSNVTVTMTYLGQGHRGSTQDELKVLQQVNGGENVCVFKGLVTPGEQFQFVSQRHRGYPFSATLYVNSIMVARISSCCEYRYAPGFQQGRKSCFRLAWLAGGIPCYRCTSLRNKYSSCQQLNNGTKENLILPLEQSPGDAGTIESCPSSPLFIPAKPAKKSVRRTRKHIKEGGGGSTDSEDLAVAGIKETSKKKRRKGQTNQKGSKGKTAGSNRGEEGEDSEGSERSTVAEKREERATSTRREQKRDKTSSNVTAPQTEQQPSNMTRKAVDSLQDEEALTKQNAEKQKDPGSNGKNRDGERLKDFYEECVEMSAALKQGPNKHHWFKANSE
nr:PREDICTED: glutamate-rich protein 3-like [Stegastes partitus]